jgi:hypothetical protein
MREESVGQVKVEMKGRGICPKCRQEKDLTADGPCISCFKKELSRPFNRCFRGVRLEFVSEFNLPA